MDAIPCCFSEGTSAGHVGGVEIHIPHEGNHVECDRSLLSRWIVLHERSRFVSKHNIQAGERDWRASNFCAISVVTTLDAFVTYLSLLSPPPGSFHDKIPAQDIVLAGDSAGGNLSMALLQLLLQLQRSAESRTPTILFHGRKVKVALPAGTAVNAPWMDVTHCMPSMEANSKYNFLPPPSFSNAHPFPPDSIWPSRPPRNNIFCENTMMCDPLISPMAVQARNWKGSPPVFIVCGEELLEDEDRVMAKRLAEQVSRWFGSNMRQCRTCSVSC